MRTGRGAQFFFYVCFCLMLFLLAGCENSEQEIKELTEKKIGVDEARMIETYFSQAGKMRAKLTAPLMYRYQDTLPRVEFPNTLHVDFYNDSMQVESILDALYGRYIEGQKKMYLKDSVVVIQKFNQDTLRCQELWWDQNKEIFYTDKPVKITKKDGTVLPGKGYHPGAWCRRLLFQLRALRRYVGARDVHLAGHGTRY